MFELFDPSSARVFPLTGLIKEIGRSKTSDISLPDDKKVSRNHARLERDGDRWIIVDLSSTNGTFVNGEQVDQKKLASGDEVRIGGTTLIFRSIEEAASPDSDEPTRVDISIPNLSSMLKRIFSSRKNK